jgi:hypothetical protein
VEVNALLRTIAAYGLPGSRPEGPREPLADRAWDELVAHVRWQRITNLLALAVTAGVIPATESQIAGAVDADIEAQTSVLRLESQLLEVAEVLDRAGTPFRVLKGPAVAHLDYPEPSLRSFGDLDLLIPPAAIDIAIEALSDEGYVRRFPEPRRGFDRRFTKSVSMVGPSGQQIDLHRTLAPGGFGQRIVVDVLWSRLSATFAVGGRTFLALGAEERFLHACYHLVLGNAPPRLVPQRDVAEMLLHGQLADDRVQILASAWNGEAVLAHAITTTVRSLRLDFDTPIVTWAAQFKPYRRERRELARATSPQYTYAAQAIDSIRAIRGSRERVAYVTALAFPRRSYLDGRHSSFAARFLHAAADVQNVRTDLKEKRD